jgi:DNA-binding CsgD family transcriptional regulator
MSTREPAKSEEESRVGAPERSLKQLALRLASECAAPFKKIERAVHLPVPHFSAEESILLDNLGAGSSISQISRQLRLSRMNLYRLLGDLRRKTGSRRRCFVGLGVAEYAWPRRRLQEQHQIRMGGN